MSSSDTESSDEEIDFTELEDAYKTVVEGLNVCLKGLQGLKKDSRDIVIREKSLVQIVRDSIGPTFGKKVINSLTNK
jgi:hypothetical protein